MSGAGILDIDAVIDVLARNTFNGWAQVTDRVVHVSVIIAYGGAVRDARGAP